VDVHAIITFGAPMIGNDAAAKAFEKDFGDKIYRYVDFEDLVPHLPSISLLSNSYAHCLNEVSLTRAAAAAATAAGFAGVEQASLTPGAADQLDPGTIDRIWDLVKSRIDSHMIANYQSRVEAKCNNPA
jgi:hypothetical protein